METKNMTVFIGCFAHSTWKTPLEILPNMAIGVYNGKILFIEKKEKLSNLIEEHNIPKECIKYLKERDILIPGFVDCHNHASQFFNCGIGYDVQLLDWLNKYTFPLEEKFSDLKFAKDAYTAAVSTLVKNGTTTACYFATIHTDATLVLCDIAEKIGQRAYVGKVCMDRNGTCAYKEDTEESLQETERFIQTVQKRKYRLITPVVTPRFAISCSEKLMKGLADIAHKYDLPIQTHINENHKEIAEVEHLFPNKTYAETYHSMGLLNNKTILAHNIHCPYEDITLIKNQGAGVSHCPISNTNLKSGMFWARQQLDAGVKLGLGTDISGGCSVSMLDVMKSATAVSNLISDGTSQKEPINYKEAFRLATLGGSKVLGLENQIGNFQVDKQFDALLVDMPRHWDQPLTNGENWEKMFSKLFYQVGNSTAIGKPIPSSKSSFLEDISLLVGPLSLAALGIFATVIIAVFVYLAWSTLTKKRDIEENQKIPYIKMETSTMSLISEDHLQPKRKESEQFTDGYRSSLDFSKGSFSSIASSRFEIIWEDSAQYPGSSWN